MDEEVAPLKTNRSILDSVKVVAYVHSEEHWAKDVLKQLNIWRLSGQMCDVTVNINGSNFECHRLVLAATCPYFQALFRHQSHALTEPILRLDAIPANGFHHILEFMYTSGLTITAMNAVDVLEAADFLQFRNIVHACSDVLSQHIGDENALALDLLATAHSCWPLAEAAHQHVVANLKVVARTKEFLSLEPAEMMRRVLANKRHCSIIDQNSSQSLAELNQIVQSWLQHSSDRSYDTILDSLMFAENSSDDENAFHNIAQLLHTASSSLETLAVVPGDASKKGTSIYYFNSVMQRWKVLTEIPFHGRSLYTSTAFDNILYICGGKESNNSATNDVFIYVVEEGCWAKDVQPMLRPRYNHSAATSCGLLYIVGGSNSDAELRNDGEVYNPNTNQWTLLPPMMHIAGVARCAVVVLENRLYVFGGQLQEILKKSEREMPSSIFRTGDRSPQLRKFEIPQYFDVEQKRWNETYEFADALRDNGVSVGRGDAFPWKGFILIIDEDLRGKKTKLYNPVTAEIVDYTRTNGQHRFGGYAILNDTLYCTGGMVERMSTHDMIHYRHLVDEMDWQFMTPLPKCLSHHACVVISKRMELAE